MSILLTKGEAVGLPQAGKQVLGTDSTGTAFLLNSDGSRAPIGSSSPVDWRTQAENFIVALDATLTDTSFYDDLVSLSVQLERAAPVGTGQVAVLSTEDGGVLSVKSGATANSFRVLQPRDAANADTTLGPRPVSNARTKHWAIAVRVKIKATTATCVLDICSMTDGLTASGAFGVYGASGSIVNWAYNNGGTTQNSGVAFVLDTWYSIVLWNDGTNTRAYVGTTVANMVLVGVAQASSTIPSAAGFPSMNAQNGATAANAEFYADKWLVRTPLSP